MEVPYKILEDLEEILKYQKNKKSTGWKWGWRIHPITNHKQFHNGIDLPAYVGTPIYCPYDAKVIKLWNDKLNGNALRLRHVFNKNIVETAYAHMYRFPRYIKYCKEDDILIKAGMIIGYVGGTGRATGSHLHFIMRLKKAYKLEKLWRRDINPLDLLENSC